MKQLSEALNLMPLTSEEIQDQLIKLPMPQHGSIKNAGQLITISSLPPRELPLSRDQEKAILSLWEQSAQCVELWKPIILEGKTRYQASDYIYHFTGNKAELDKAIKHSLQPASHAAKINALTLLAMHRPMKEASNDRVTILLEDYAYELGNVSEIALIEAVDELKRDSGDDTGRWFPMVGEILRAVKRHEKQLTLLTKASNEAVPEGYMRAGKLSFMAEEILRYDGFSESTTV